MRCRYAAEGKTRDRSDNSLRQWADSPACRLQSSCAVCTHPFSCAAPLLHFADSLLPFFNARFQSRRQITVISSRRRGPSDDVSHLHVCRDRSLSASSIPGEAGYFSQVGLPDSASDALPLGPFPHTRKPGGISDERMGQARPVSGIPTTTLA